MLTQLYYKMNLIYFKIMQNFRVLQNSTITSGETGFTPGSQPPSVPVLEPGVRNRD